MKETSLWQNQEVRRKLEEAIEETINAFYEISAWDYDVWEIGYSGGKDSTAVVTLIAYLIASGRLPRPKRVIVQYADTGMELPPLHDSALRILKQLEAYGIEVEVVRPELDDRFFVYMFGRGVPPPNNGRMRWCTRILKSKPMTLAMKGVAGKKLIITGVREGESAARDGRIVAACNKDSGECGQGYLHVKTASDVHADPFAPILSWRVCHSARTGCMECRLVQEDHMMERVLAIPKYAYLAPVRQLRPLYEELVQDSMRLQKDGTQRLKDGGLPKNLYRKGPLTMDARRYGLARVKQIQAEVNQLARAQGVPEISLISLEEEQRILELITANTWPQGWTGTEPLASEFEQPVPMPAFVQLSWSEEGGETDGESL